MKSNNMRSDSARKDYRLPRDVGRRFRSQPRHTACNLTRCTAAAKRRGAALRALMRGQRFRIYPARGNTVHSYTCRQECL
jgi:hypothetical protein